METPNGVVEPVDQIAPPIKEDNDAQPLSSSEDIDKIPLQEKPVTPAPKEKTPAQEPAPATQEPTPKEPADGHKPIYEGAPEKKPGTTPGDAATTQPTKSKEAQEILNTPAPRGVHAKNWEDAKKKWSGIVEAKDTQLQKIQRDHSEAVALLQQENEKLAKRVADLSGYESVIERQQSPEFTRDYLEPITRVENGLVEYAKSVGASEAGLAELKQNLNNENYLLAVIEDFKKNNRPDVARKFQFEVEKLANLRQRRDIALDDMKQNHSKFVESKKAETVKKTAEYDRTVKESVTSYSKSFNRDGMPDFPFLVKQVMPQGAAPEQRKVVEDHNKWVDENLSAIDQMARNEDPKERVRMVVGYMTAVVQQSVIKDLQQKLEAANKFVEEVKKRTGGPERGGGGSLPGAKQVEGPLSENLDSLYRR